MQTTHFSIPTLTTERLTLRPLQLADFADYAAFWASDRSKYMGGPLAQNAAWKWFCHDAAQWQFFGHGSLMIEVTENQTCVGQVSINDGPIFPEKDLGWILYEGFEGKGYASEAAQAMLNWSFATLGHKGLVSYVEANNRASSAIATKLGATIDTTAIPLNPTDLVFRHRSS